MSGIKPTPADVGTPDATNISNRWARLSVIAAAAAAAVLVWVVSVIFIGTSLEVRIMPGAKAIGVSITMVAIVAILAGLAAWCVLVLAQRTLRRGTRAWRILGSALLAFSFLGPVAAATNSGTLTVLLIMHGVVGCTLLTLLPQPGTPRRQRR